MSNKKILLTYALPYPHIGGLSTHMQLLGKGLNNLGYEVDFISNSSFPRIIQLLLFNGPIYIFDQLYAGFGSIIYFNYIPKLLFNLLYAYKLITGNYDLINSHHVFSTPYSNLTKIFKIPVILTVHTYFTYEMISMGVIQRNNLFLQKTATKYEKKTYDLVSHIITVDNRLKEYLIDLGVNSNKIDVIYNCVDTDIFKPRNDKKNFKDMFNLPVNKKVLLVPRRLEKKNGVIYPLLVFLKLKREDIVLVYAGDGQEKESLKNIIKENSLENKVFLLGSI